MENQLYAKLNKCSFYQNKLLYLGHIISEEGIIVDLVKIKVIQEWSIARNVCKVRFFMDLGGYFRNFIEAFSQIA